MDDDLLFCLGQLQSDAFESIASVEPNHSRHGSFAENVQAQHIVAMKTAQTLQWSQAWLRLAARNDPAWQECSRMASLAVDFSERTRKQKDMHRAALCAEDENLHSTIEVMDRVHQLVWELQRRGVELLDADVARILEDLETTLGYLVELSERAQLDTDDLKPIFAAMRACKSQRLQTERPQALETVLGAFEHFSACREKVHSWTLKVEERQGKIKNAQVRADQDWKAVTAAKDALKKAMHNAEELEPMMDPAWNHDYCHPSKTHGGDHGWPHSASVPLEKGGAPYYCPKGWMRYGVKVHNFHERFGDWQVAYHGTAHHHAMSILSNGLNLPGTGAAVVGLGQLGADQPAIYCTPSVEYAGNPVYSRVYKKGDRKLQMVLQLRVQPSPDKKQDDQGTGLWKRVVDPNFAGKGDEIEWLYYDPSRVVVYGIMLREVKG